MRNLFRWLWTTYQTLALWQKLLPPAIAGGTSVIIPILDPTAECPPWSKIVISGAIALALLPVVGWIGNPFSDQRKTRRLHLGQSKTWGLMHNRPKAPASLKPRTMLSQAPQAQR